MSELQEKIAGAGDPSSTFPDDGWISAEPLLDTAAVDWSSTVIHADISDLLFYLSYHNHVSGIQRVLLELIETARLSAVGWGAAVRWCAMDYVAAELMHVDNDMLYELVDEVNGQKPARDAIDSLIQNIKDNWLTSECRKGDIYLPVGAFWVSNATASMLASMQRAGVKTGVLIYDLIPITHPEYCEISLTKVFTRQVNEILHFVNFAFTISEHVKTELVRYMLDRDIPAVPVVALPLGHSQVAKFQSDNLNPSISGLARKKFVLAVGTLEIRKNHGYLLHIWRRMLRERGPENTPLLVLVGRIGWRVADLMAQLDASNYLNDHVLILSDLSDGDLNWLYENCQFTTFASFVEGWGLPVGESLANGKVPVVSSTSSIPEVGGDLAIYFDPMNVNDGYDKIVTLIDDEKALSNASRRIEREFHPRTWNEVGKQLFGESIKLAKKSALGPMSGYVTLPTGEWLPFGEGDSSNTSISGPSASLGCTQGWHTTEAWGRWSSYQVATITFRAEPDTEYSVLLECNLPPWSVEHGVIVHNSAGRKFKVPFSPAAKSIVKFDITAPESGLLAFDLETFGSRIFGETRWLGIGVSRMLYYPKDDLIMRLEAIERIAFDKINISMQKFV